MAYNVLNDYLPENFAKEAELEQNQRRMEPVSERGGIKDPFWYD